jgi:protein TonB
MFHTRRIPALTVSLAFHVACFAALSWPMRPRVPASGATSRLSDRTIVRMVWLNAPGPGGGGGGGGSRKKDPPRRAELPGRDAVTVPAAKPRAPDFSKPAAPEPEPVPQLLIPVATLAAATDLLPQIGAVDAPHARALSRGPGDGDGAGAGHGSGDGPGRGPGFGDGQDGNIGGGVYRPGNEVTMPVEIQKGVPRYTSEAMRARIQGSVIVECVVQTTGACTDIRVSRSFDPSFGLADEAIKAVAQWRFRPGTRRGQPVPVIVTMEIAFALR